MLLAGDCDFRPDANGRTCKCGQPLEQHLLWERRFGAGMARATSSESAPPRLKSWDRQTLPALDSPHGWIQWKGTQVCMEVNCSCGFKGHADEEFFYFFRCPDCKKVWRVNGHVEFVEVYPDEEKSLGEDITELHQEEAVQGEQ